MIKMHVGFDDTDSIKGGCTTYIAALLVEKLHELEVFFLDYPNLIRLNPNIPWKTRGNGAICLRFECDEERVDKIMEIVAGTIEKNADLDCVETDPGIVFFFNEVPKELRLFAKKTIQGVAEIEEALRLIEKYEGEFTRFKRGRGIVGGLAAIGETLNSDHTFEILTYRELNNRGTPRNIQLSSVFEMDNKISASTFNNIDPETGRVLVTPRGPDPILYGIRGETPEAVKMGHNIIHSNEKIERWVIFRTNQGTDAHLKKIELVSNVKPFNPVIVRGMVNREPRVLKGGHVIFSVKDVTGQVDCAAYEPTGSLREIVKKLIIGDLVEICGGVRPPSNNPTTINLEKISVLELTPKLFFRNPICPDCGRRTKSMGSRKGFKCKKCGFRSANLEKMAIEIKRFLKKGVFITPPRSQRHLTKPLCRYGKEKVKGSSKMIKKWHFP
jgi:tRNA(Ile2)-agmatinylcytidine synthase